MPRWAQQFLCVPASYGGEVTFTFTKGCITNMSKKVFRIDQSSGRAAKFTAAGYVISQSNPKFLQ